MIKMFMWGTQNIIWFILLVIYNLMNLLGYLDICMTVSSPLHWILATT